MLTDYRMGEREPVIVIHGGAWAVPDCLAAASMAGVRTAASRAWHLLQALDQKLNAIRENSKMFFES